MIISCPNCSTGYLLPEHLLGPGGARVRCPRCQQVFVVDREGVPQATAVGPAASEIRERPQPDTEERGAGPGDTTAGALHGSGPHEQPLQAAVEEHLAGPSSEAPGDPGPLEAARAVLADLAVREGEALERARAEQRLFADHGPALLLAYETWRRRVGAGADASAFRTALRERWGVELLPLSVRDRA
jgi:predicted Zn finger-like uncharacterized protein